LRKRGKAKASRLKRHEPRFSSNNRVLPERTGGKMGKMKVSHHRTPGVFGHFVNSAAFFDTVTIHVWGKRRAVVLDHVRKEKKTRAIGGYGRAYARCAPGHNEATGNAMQFKYGVLLPYRNVSPFVVIVWAGSLPVTWADLTLVIDAFVQRGWRARIASVELTFDTEGIPIERFSRELCTTARTVREFEGEYGTTIYVGGSNSSWRLKIYQKTYAIARIEFTLQNRFLRKHGIHRPQELSLLRKVNLWNHVSFRKVDQTHGQFLPRRIRDPWTWLGHGLPPADLPPSVLLKTLREVRVDPKPFVVRSAGQTLLRHMQHNLIW
jgi:hypothetical protein